MSLYPAVQATLAEIAQQHADSPELAQTFDRCFPNTLETTVRRLEDSTTFVITGDIEAMWLRDSSAQVWPYLPLAPHDSELRAMLAGLIERQARCVLLDPYANAFNLEPRGGGHADEPTPHPLVWERKFEIDSLCYPLRLAYHYWRRTGDAAPLSGSFRRAASVILDTLRCEQRHDERSTYRFWRPEPVLATDNLPDRGHGHPVAFTGMIWSAFRPSDDACTYNYNVPGNMMAAVELGHLAEMARDVWGDRALEQEALAFSAEIAAGIEHYGTVQHPEHGRMYAYETDGFGQHLLMDDANVPSLLSIPYLGYRPATDPTYQSTRAFVLSSENPYYFTGRFACGVGSPHTPAGFVWPIALAMQGLTAVHGEERARMLEMLTTTTAGTGLMHESFHPDDPGRFTREWFGWANSLFAELVECASERSTSSDALVPQAH